MSIERNGTNRGNGARVEVTSAEEMRDGGNMTRGKVTETYATGQSASPVHQETVRQPVGASREAEIQIPEAYNLDRDRVRWGPIWAGLLTALTTLLLLSLLGLAVGLTAVDAERAAREGGVPLATGVGTAIWGALSAILAFLLGGFVAGRTAAIFNRRWGALNGALVFLLGVPVILYLAGTAIGGLLGTLGNYAAGLDIDPNQVRAAAQGAANQAGQAAQNAPAEQVGRAAENARNGAWGTLLGLLLGLGASALGGALGTRRDLDVDRRTGNVRE